MKVLSWTLVALSLLSPACKSQSARQGAAAISVGMSWPEAQGILRCAKAEPTQLDMLLEPPAGRKELFCYELRGGRALAIVTDRPNGTAPATIVRLHLCENLGQPKNLRTWRDVQTAAVAYP